MRRRILQDTVSAALLRSLTFQGIDGVLKGGARRVKSDRETSKQNAGSKRGHKSQGRHVSAIVEISEPEIHHIPRGRYCQQVTDDQQEHELLCEYRDEIPER